jgi:hypothetical protein
MFLFKTSFIPKSSFLIVSMALATTLATQAAGAQEVDPRTELATDQQMERWTDLPSSQLLAQQTRRGVRRRPAQAAAPAKKRARSNSKSEIGLGYTLWNERFAVTKSGVTQNGYAGFGGFIATLERNWTKYRWQYGGNVSFGVGKASAGGVTTLPEGRDRPWYTASVSPFFNYRFNMNFMAGMGALVRYRAVDWTSLDVNTKIEETSRFQATGVVNLRWSLGRWTLIQSFAPLDFQGDTLWTWTAQYVL